MRLHRLLLPLACLAAIAGCGSSSSSGGGEDPAAAIPKGTLVYVEARRPARGRAGRQRASAAGEVPSFGDDAREPARRGYQGGRRGRDLRQGHQAVAGRADRRRRARPRRRRPDLHRLRPDRPTATRPPSSSSEEGKDKGAYEDFKLFQDDDTWAGVGDDLIVFAENRGEHEEGHRRRGRRRPGRHQGLRGRDGELPDERLGALYVDLEGAARPCWRSDPDVDAQGKAVLEQAARRGQARRR